MNHSLTTRSLVLGGAVAILLGGAIATTVFIRNKADIHPGENPPVTLDSTQLSPKDEGQQNIQENRPQAAIYWLKFTDTETELQAIALENLPSENAIAQLEQALKQLLSQSPGGDLSSTIPPDTQLLGLRVETDNIYLDLSEEFTFGGGSMAMQGRLGQVIYTVTSVNPEAKVWLNVAGEPLTLLGGEGLMVDQPMTRDLFRENYPLTVVPMADE